MKNLLFLLLALLPMTLWGVRHDVPRDSIILSDPCILADSASQTYYMTGTGGRLWTSRDLSRWSGPYDVAAVDTASWMGRRRQSGRRSFTPTKADITISLPLPTTLS